MDNMQIFLKIAKFIFLIFILVLIINVVLEKRPTSKPTFGVTFSPKYAKYLKLDWRKTYLETLDELKVKNLRLPTYWDVLEKDKDKYDFTETDFMVDQASKRGARIILVVGARQPRWPECHIPSWAKSLSMEERKQKVLEFIEKVVERYKNRSEIWAWQVENEPLLGSFGEGCDSPDKDFLKQEVSLVKDLSKKKIIMTDSGELGFWATSMQFSDVFGTTVYRRVNDRFLGNITYPVLPFFYSIKSSLIRSIFGSGNQKTIIVELQAEPWLADGNFVEPKQQTEIFTTKNFEDYINFAQKTGFDEVYLWGVEWWYAVADKGYPEYLEYAKTIFR